MKPPSPNSSFFASHPPQPCDDDGKPLKTRLREPKRSIKRDVVNHPDHQRAQRPPMHMDQAANERRALKADIGEWVDELPERRRPGQKESALVALLKSHPGRWRRLREVKYCGGFGTLRKHGCEIAVRAGDDGRRWAYARWPAGKK